MDIRSLGIKAVKRSTVIDPQKIFDALTLRGDIDNLWSPQSAALSKWNAERTASDVVIEMNTGGGKTLVGLLIAQSLSNELAQKVVYVCANKQLVEQTANKATDVSIHVATYLEGSWSNREVFDSCAGPCLTTYQAVFNGKSIFRRETIGGVILDDAHVAGAILRDQFTIRLPPSGVAFKKIAELFRPYFIRNNLALRLNDALRQDPRELLFVPSFEVSQNEVSVQQLLIDAGVDEDRSTLFAWNHLKDHIGRCALIISGTGLEITPTLLPVTRLNIFEQSVRRVYLTATLQSQAELVRLFGATDLRVQRPGGKSGEAQRQFLFIAGQTDEAQRETSKQLLADHKACIITPSGSVATHWCPPGHLFGSQEGNAGIEAFAGSPNGKLVLAGRFDGIDLPGKSCRILVIDGLPSAASLYDRFIDETLRLPELRGARLATRVIQAMGRIFRSNTDHGCLLICGSALQRWLLDPNNQAYMPPLLQKQILLGIQLSQSISQGKADYESLMRMVLDGDSAWDEVYSEFVEDTSIATRRPVTDWFHTCSLREREAFEQLWNDNYAEAATGYDLASKLAQENGDLRLGAWYRHWQGLALLRAGDADGSMMAYLDAASHRVELGRPKPGSRMFTFAADGKLASDQAKRIVEQAPKGLGRLRAAMEELCPLLAYGPDTSQCEEALRRLGDGLGLTASRPDKDVGTGPDVIWLHKAQGVALEAKTDKVAGGTYRKKDDIGQFGDHVVWLQQSHPKSEFYKVIVGRPLDVASEANPPADLQIVGVEQFEALATRLVEALAYAEALAPTLGLEQALGRSLGYFGLDWPRCVTSLESVLAADLKAT